MVGVEAGVRRPVKGGKRKRLNQRAVHATADAMSSVAALSFGVSTSVMRKLPLIAAEELLELIMRRYDRASTLVTSNRPVEDWGKLLGDAAAVSAMLDRLLHHGHLLKCGPRSWRTKTGLPDGGQAG